MYSMCSRYADENNGQNFDHIIINEDLNAAFEEIKVCPHVCITSPNLWSPFSDCVCWGFISNMQLFSYRGVWVIVPVVLHHITHFCSRYFRLLSQTFSRR